MQNVARCRKGCVKPQTYQLQAESATNYKVKNNITLLAVPGEEDLKFQLLRGWKQEGCEFKASLSNFIKPPSEKVWGEACVELELSGRSLLRVCLVLGSAPAPQTVMSSPSFSLDSVPNGFLCDMLGVIVTLGKVSLVRPSADATDLTHLGDTHLVSGTAFRCSG